MKIKRLALTNFRRFKSFEITLEAQLTVLVARNGAGKSSVLDALATLFGAFLTRLPKIPGTNLKDTDFRLNCDGSKPAYMCIECETYDGIAWDRTERRDKSKATSIEMALDGKGIGLKHLNDYVDKYIDAQNTKQDYQLPILVYYGTGRGVFDVPQRTRGFGKEFSRFDSFRGALDSRANFKRFVEYFYFLEKKEGDNQKRERSFDVQLPELKAIRSAISRLLPDFSNPRVAHPAGIMVDWLQNGEKKQLRIEQLSDGYRTTLAMVMDIASRMAEANPHMDDPLATKGVVLIDEVDLHLHPGWQQTILTDLVRAFPNIQFVVSTHSPQVVSSVKPESLRIIDWINDDAVLRTADFSEGAESQQMLQDVLGVEFTRPQQLQIVKDLNEYQKLVEIDKWDSERAKQLRIKLDNWGREHEPELARLDMDIRLKQLDRVDEANK